MCVQHYVQGGTLKCLLEMRGRLGALPGSQGTAGGTSPGSQGTAGGHFQVARGQLGHFQVARGQLGHFQVAKGTAGALPGSQY